METLDTSSKESTLAMHHLLTNHFGMDSFEATMLMSLSGDLNICQVVDPLMTTRFEFPIKLLPEKKFTIKNWKDTL
jgi:amidase